MDLGEQIALEGFLEREPGDLLIAKKLIGNHVKALSTRLPGFERLVLRLEYASTITVHGALTLAGKTHEATAHDANVFFALDACLKSLGR
jgi:hypothetical protein